MHNYGVLILTFVFLYKRKRDVNEERYSLYAIVNDRLSALELAITPDMGHGWASDVALSNIHERSSLTSRFLLYKNTKVSIKTP